jgi:SAM-dependent methyltransferase
MTILKVNLGCGEKYLDGYCNVDKDRGVKADLYHDIEDSPLPKCDYIWVDNVLEHLTDVGIQNVMDSLKPGGELEGVVPHYLSRHAYNDIGHKTFFNVNTFHSIKQVIVYKLRVYYCFSKYIRFWLPPWLVRFHERLLPGVLSPSHMTFLLWKDWRGNR